MTLDGTTHVYEKCDCHKICKTTTYHSDGRVSNNMGDKYYEEKFLTKGINNAFYSRDCQPIRAFD